MAVWADMLEFFPHTLSVRAWSSESSSGVVAYAAAAQMVASIKDEVKVWKWEDGNELQSKRTIYANGEVGKKDEVTLPVGFEPRIVFPIHCIRRFDEYGVLHHTELYI